MNNRLENKSVYLDLVVSYDNVFADTPNKRNGGYIEQNQTDFHFETEDPPRRRGIGETIRSKRRYFVERRVYKHRRNVRNDCRGGICARVSRQYRRAGVRVGTVEKHGQTRFRACCFSGYDWRARKLGTEETKKKGLHHATALWDNYKRHQRYYFLVSGRSEKG